MKKDYKILDIPNLTKEELQKIVSYLSDQLWKITQDRNIIKGHFETMEKNCRNAWSNLQSTKRKLKEVRGKLQKN